MPTLAHGALVEMFRENPPLAPHLLQTLFQVDVPRHGSVRVVDSTLDQAVPVELRADLVLELRDASGEVVFAIILEVQRGRDDDKRYSWPVYLAVTRSRKRCPVIVMVVCTDPEVARWAAAGIDLGLGLSHVKPLVLGPGSLPVVTDPAVAEQERELAVLSALVHGNGPNGLAVVEAASSALAGLDVDHAALYFHVIYQALRDPMRAVLEKVIMERSIDFKNIPLPPFAQKLVDRGEREGELKGKRETLFRLTARAGIVLTDEERLRIQGNTDIATLDRWLDNVLGAKTAAEVLT